jgi:hypothetical protein
MDEPVVEKWQRGELLGAFERRLLERAVARMLESDGVFPLKSARAWADELVAVFVANGVTFTRAWDAPKIGARVYFPAEAGFLSVSRGGDISTVFRGRRAFDPAGLPASWRAKVREALSHYERQRITV